MRGAGEQYPLPNKVLVLLVLADASTPLRMTEVSRVIARKTLGEVAMQTNVIRAHVETLLDGGFIDEKEGGAVGDRNPERLFVINPDGRTCAATWRAVLSDWGRPHSSTLPPAAPTTSVVQLPSSIQSKTSSSTKKAKAR